MGDAALCSALARLRSEPGSGPLACRTREWHAISKAVSDLLAHGRSGCVYVCGGPGTGKTATVVR